MDLDKVPDAKCDPRFAKGHHQRAAKPTSGAGYRHSYAEPKLRAEQQQQQQKNFKDILQRTNSSVSSNTGRVGIASIHPY